MKKMLLSGLIFIIFLLVLIQVVQAKDALDYYAYGDSITSGEGVASLNDVYISQMVATHDPTKTVDHNTDGSGQYSSWGLANFATHPGIPYPLKVYIMFGMNDKHYDQTTEFTYLNLEAMYHAYTAKGSDTHILIETLAQDGQGDWSTYANQRSRIIDIQNYLDAKSIPYIKIYDAIDSIPGNCYPDEVNMSLMYNSRHPNTEGHRLMGEYIWAGTCSGTASGVPVARFKSDTTSGIAPLTVMFTDQSASTLPLTYAWDFDNDGVTDSTAQNPSYVYSSAGTYTVSLTVTNIAGSNSEVKMDYITVEPVPIPVTKFTGVPTSGFVPLTVQFTDTSTNSPTAWNWTFGDGSLANHTQQNPIHTYTKTGVYTVSLNATNTWGSNTKTIGNYITVTEAPVAPVANFTVTPKTGNAPLTVIFTDISTGLNITTWNWSFGDGTWVDSTVSTNPVHTYAEGTWYPTLTVTNVSGSNTSFITSATTITVTHAPPIVSTKIGVTNGQSWYLDRNGNGTWDVGTDKAYSFGAPGWIPIVGDWNATGYSFIGVTNGQQWYLDWNGNGSWDGMDKAYSFGAPGWTPIVGDWNHDGKTDIGVTNGQQWYLDTNGNGTWDNGLDSAYNFGAPGWIPIVGDWNATGYSFIGVTNGQQWYLDWNGNGSWDGMDKAYSFGAPGWTPIVGDWNHDGKTDIGVTNGQQWYLDMNNNGVFDNGVDKAYSFGAPGWTPIVGDWNVDATGTKIGVTNGQQWYLDSNGNGVWDNGVDYAYSFGAFGWTPVVGKWS